MKRTAAVAVAFVLVLRRSVSAGLGQAGWQDRSRQLFELASQLPRTTPDPPKP